MGVGPTPEPQPTIRSALMPTSPLSVPSSVLIVLTASFASSSSSTSIASSRAAMSLILMMSSCLKF